LRQKWNERLFKEMYFSFLLGRSEKDPSEGWYKGELWFFDFYVIPLARKLKECGVFGVSSDEYLDYALRNRNEWERKGKEVSETFLEAVKKEAHKKGLTRMISVEEDEQESESEECASVSNDMSAVAAAPAMDTADQGDQESDSEGSVSNDVMPDVAAAPASAPKDVAVEAASTNPASSWIVLAPPGKLGIVIDTTAEGPVVHRVSVGSVMKLKLAPGDVITSIDGVETAGLSAEAVSALMSARAQHSRTLTVQRSRLRSA
jgi:hypothetical protein